MGKRSLDDRPSWDEMFMGKAFWAATRSSCFHLNTGVVIVKDNREIAGGYNGAPSGVKNSLERGYCSKEKHGFDFDSKGSGTCIGLHAEINAMNQTSMNDLNGATMYTVYFPCTPCAKAIIGNNLSKVVYSKIYKEKDSLAEELFKEKGIEIVQMNMDLERAIEVLSKLK